ncbi:UDP-N-acetylmuramate dehydrogenase [Demequina sp. TTPB684]|uniref:UDP-N-acetylmuramate dehydrogenase n=1 Tax=unclassified Demequina TaxID=2620311 RepID=UPI001CF4D9E9|nr:MULTISPECIES: UDP-N-acetylmuramate dehydrogenase [unclassified Demequina]MCB2412959.1 UDP-N-acetylmuramate dehydrogenase [Demequina sp. TTPB684]UPU88353.1 UDP-N-acetylmuramate dehydrogenase [Demequina sp. TMPB413]
MTAFADLTTLRVGGPARELVEAASDDELIEAMRDADAAGTPVLVLGGGSNLLVSDAGFNGVVVRDARRDVDSHVTLQNDGACGGLTITAAAGVPWDALVERAVASKWSGFEALSGIPGSTGATPVQNVGAYGADVSEIIAQVRTWDRATQSVRTLPLMSLGFSYRDSLLKRSMRGGADDGALWAPSPRYVVLSVTFHTRMASLSAPVRYAQLAAALGVQQGERVPITEVREAVLALRRSKGMVLDRADPDTWSAGSFFTNPVLDASAAAALDPDAPRFPAGPGAPDGAIKTSAAWLIEHAGFGKGFAVADDARASLSTKHTLALTNRGGASAEDLVQLARAVRDGVRERFGVTLMPEPVTLGVEI